MGRPGRTDRGRVKGITQLTNSVDGLGVEVKGKAIQAVVSGDRRVRVPGLEVVECELDVRKEAVPKAAGKSGWVEAKVEIRWFFAVLTDFSAGLDL